MSKRAEELYNILDVNGLGDIMDQDKAVPLIDAELRKERERCAERFKARIEQWEPISTGLVQIKTILLTDGVAAILGDSDGI